MIKIRRALPNDKAEICQIFRNVVDEGNAFLADDAVSQDDININALFFGDGVLSFVATKDSLIVGGYYVKPVHIGRGNHIANASYMVAQESRRHGIGRLMAEHPLRVAKDQGFRAMQFNAAGASGT